MQQHLKNDLLYLLRILESAEKIILYSDIYDNPSDFFSANDQKDFNGCLNLVAQIGEQSNKLSQTLINKYNQIDWIKIRGLRNRIVHDYTGIDVYIIFDIIKKSIPELKPKIVQIVKTELQNNNFDKDELAIAQTSPYLRHVDFTLFN